MRRPLAHLAEVAGRAHDAFAEVVLPDAVDHHARGERIVLPTRATRRSRGGASWTSRSRAGSGNVYSVSLATESTPGVISGPLAVRAAAMQEVRRLRRAAALADRQRRRRTARAAASRARRSAALTRSCFCLHVLRHQRDDVGFGDKLRERIVGERLLDLLDVELLALGALLGAASSTRPACTRAASRSLVDQTSCWYGASRSASSSCAAGAAEPSMRCVSARFAASTSARHQRMLTAAVEKKTD